MIYYSVVYVFDKHLLSEPITGCLFPCVVSLTPPGIDARQKQPTPIAISNN